MVDSSWLTDTDIDAIGTTNGKCSQWITANIDRIDKHSKGHVLLFSDSKELTQLAELLSEYSSSLGGLIEATHGSLKQKGGNANHLRFMRSVLTEASMFGLDTLGTINLGRDRKTLLVLRRKPNVPSDAECQRLYQRWLDAMQQSLYELNAVMTFEKGELEIRKEQSSNSKSGLTAGDALKQELHHLSFKKQKQLGGLSEQELHQELITNPEYKGTSRFIKRRQQLKKLKRYRKQYRRILP